MRRIPILLAAAGLLLAGCMDPMQPAREDLAAAALVAPAVPVAAPTGDPAIDVANIRAAIAAALPGAVIEFAAGTYAIEETTQIVVPVPGVTLKGNSSGTTIRGVPSFSAALLSGHFQLTGGGQSVRKLTFDGFSTALSFGVSGSAVGGYLLDHCIFRNGGLPFDFAAFSDEISTVKFNEFTDVTLAFMIFGKTVHFRKNSITITDPARTPFGQPFAAGLVAPDFLSPVPLPCENNVLERTTVTGNADGYILVGFPDAPCRNNTIKRNVFVNQRVYSPGDNATMVWAAGTGVDGNLITKNELRGSEGVGLIIDAGSGNQIVQNQFRDIHGAPGISTPFPGTAIFLDQPTSANRTRKNVYVNVTRAIVDLGTGNILDDLPPGGLMFPAAQALSVDGRERGLASIPKLRFLLDRARN